ncbi:sortase [bacterium]|nr:sortase [bacterium]
MKSKWNIQIENETKLKRTKTIISVVLAVSGLIIIASQSIPLLKSYIDGVITQTREDVKVNPVSEEYKTYIENEFAFYDPGKNYFENLAHELVLGASSSSKGSAKHYVIDTSYSKPMYITISSIEINHILITPNVESTNADVYNSYLKKGIAHFKGTPIPGDGGNSFLYGHSAVESFFSSHKNYPETIFSKLSNIEIGDIVEIEKDGSTLKYVVRTKKIVEADDFSVLDQNANKESITMMTCWPLGIGTKRLVVYAERKS